MVFTKIEIDIAKQIVKAAGLVLLVFVLIAFLGKFIYGFDLGSGTKNATSPNPEPIARAVKGVPLETPLSIEISGYEVNARIEAPLSNDTKVLDDALARGPVYYPGSGLPGSNNVLIFGHSTTFNVVINKSFAVFNNLKDVQPGTLIYVKTQSAVHIYKTRDVKRVSKYTSWIQFKSNTPMLTLATCDSFGKASDRWVLEADYVGVR
jgi:LPXTG-site transpeptidase (sortase) family protein